MKKWTENNFLVALFAFACYALLVLFMLWLFPMSREQQELYLQSRSKEVSLVQLVNE